MIVVQTFATDIIDNLNKEALDRMLALHYISSVSIKKQLKKEDKFVLITDTKGKEYTKEFPYDDILTVLDDYPYERPIKMSAYKLYTIEVFANKDFVHLDNDIMLFKPIPKFKDTLVQSCEGNFVQTVYNNKVQHYDWKFPSYIKDITHNYNPGIYGFTASSKVREIYYKTFLEYSKKNIDFVKGIESPIKKMLYKKEMQDVYLFLEEGLLWYLCSRLKVSPVEMIPNKYDEKLKPWGVFKKGKYREVDWTITFRICYMNWRKEKYVHLMNYNHLIANWKTSFLPQEVLLEVYYENKELVERLLKNDLWSA